METLNGEWVKDGDGMGKGSLGQYEGGGHV